MPSVQHATADDATSADDATADVMTSQEYGSVAKCIIDCYIGPTKGQQLVKHQLDSYNDFVARKLEQIIEGFNPIDLNNTYLPEHQCYKYVISISITNPVVSKPMICEKDGSTKVMLPNDARLRNMTYAAPLTVDVAVTAKTFCTDACTYSADSKKLNGVNLGRIPIMVRSRYCMLSQQQVPSDFDECRYDYGGYFVVNGNEKVIISQDRIAKNRTYVFLNNKASCYSHTAEVRSVQETRFGVPKITTLKLSSKANQFGRCIRIAMHHIKQDIPLFIVFRALGMLSDRDIAEHVVYDMSDATDSTAVVLIKELAGCMDEASGVRTQADAIDYLVRHMQPHNSLRDTQPAQKIAAVRNLLKKDFLPHVGLDLYKKALYLGYMVNRLLRCYLRMSPLDDRDSYINKRLDTPGVLLANLFRQYYGKVVKDMRTLMQKDINAGAWRATKLINILHKANIYKIIKPTVIQSGLKYGLATGNWGVKTSRVRQGVAQVLNRMTYVATLSHMRRINTPIEKTGKLVQPRKLHPTQWGVVCPSETPEGASVGLVKNLALLTSITMSTPSDPVRNVLMSLAVTAYDEKPRPSCFAAPGAVKVVVNGDIMGWHTDPSFLYTELKKRKRAGIISGFTSVVWNIMGAKIALCTDGGRFLRPVLIVDGGERLAMGRRVAREVREGRLTWSELVLSSAAGAVEYLDVDETIRAMIAMNHADLGGAPRYTHMEIDPCAMLGVVAGSIPFSDHNQAPRNTYQSAMGKQAIGIYATNFRHRFDTMSHVLNYPQKPLVSTHTARILNCDNLPCGSNATVAIACFTGFNQEGSVIINRSAVNRGMFVSSFYRTFREQNNKNHSTGEEEFFCRPDPLTTRNMKPYNYAKLAPCGFVDEDTFVEAGDVLIGKCMPQKHGSVIINKDTSVALKSNERGFVDRNCYGNRHFTNVTGDGYTFAKVRIRNERVPTIGDKVSSRHGQKGTIGMLYSEEDMPFTASGIVPSIIMNPHAIPSRMTIGQLMEALESKVCASKGCVGDASPFNGRTAEDIAAELESYGMERYGNEIMYNPRTGEQVPCAVFVCPTYYQRLKHMVEDKVHSRATNGPVVLLTRQPAEGRARDGGLRLGEMELECMWAHGTIFFLKERFMECSDNYRVFVCKECGMMSQVNPERGIYHCKMCKNITNFAEIRIPLASKLLFQEIQTMAIGTRFITN